MAIKLHTLNRSTEGEQFAALEQKIAIAAGESHAVINIPAGRAVTVDVEPGAGATATVYQTLESDNDTIAAGTAPPGSTWLRAWPAGGVVVGTTDTFHDSTYAVVCHSAGGVTTFRVRL